MSKLNSRRPNLGTAFPPTTTAIASRYVRHRGAAVEYYLLPQAERAVMALGHAMAYAAARDSGAVPASLLAIYKAGVVRAYTSQNPAPSGRKARGAGNGAGKGGKGDVGELTPR